MFPEVYKRAAITKIREILLMVTRKKTFIWRIECLKVVGDKQQRNEPIKGFTICREVGFL